MLPALLLVALAALTPVSDTIAPVQLPETDNPSNREALAVVHNRALRIVPFRADRYLVLYPSRKDEVSGAMMRGEGLMPYVITAAAALPREAREGNSLGQLLDAALLDEKTFAASATLPVTGNQGGIIFYDFGPDFEPNAARTIRLRGCVGAVAPGPWSSVVALTDGGITVLTRDGLVLGEFLKDAIGGGCADNRLTRVSRNQYAVYDAAKQQVIVFRLEVPQQQGKAGGPDWRDADYGTAPIAKVSIEKTLDVSAGGGEPVKSLHVDAKGNVFLVRGGDTVVRFDDNGAQSWRAQRDWAAVHWDGDTLVALTRNAHWQRLKF
ncbi:MAG TPA: hypothetical protein VJ276_09470 [Thermoanaerobaculia bacterium]|nr:hypothetical protein [Thermoanaerobaculia bacterium]